MIACGNLTSRPLPQPVPRGRNDRATGVRVRRLAAAVRVHARPERDVLRDPAHRRRAARDRVPAPPGGPRSQEDHGRQGSV